MKRSWILLLGLSISLLAGATPPNIVVILCDDLGYGEIQCLNPERGKISTPHVDQLALEGMVFTDAHSGSSVCTPTRYGLLTGRYAWRTRLQKGVLSHGKPLIAPETSTVAQLMKQAGYQTACVGKWHLGLNYTDDAGNPMHVKDTKERHGAPVGAKVVGSPVEYGFDQYYGFDYARCMRSMIKNDRVVQDLDLDKNLDALADYSEQFIAKQAEAGTPFFLYVALGSPHTPIVPSQEWIGKSGVNEYFDFVMETDHTAGRIVQALKEHGLDEHTLVIFSSDNGCSAGPAKAAGTQADMNHYPSANLRGYKSDVWDGGHRVPFIVRWPAKIQPGLRSSQLLSLTDLMATCADLTGQKLAEDAGVDSVSFLPVLSNPEYASRESVIHHSINGNFAIRQGKWKLAVAHGSGGWTLNSQKAVKQKLPSMQLYDMEADIGESINLITEHPELVDTLLTTLKKQVDKGRTTSGPVQQNDVDVEVVKR